MKLDLPKMAVLLAAAIAAVSCSKTRTCKTGTLLVDITLDTNTGGADYVDLDVSVDGTIVGTFKKISTAARRTGTIEVSFANGYPAGKTVTVTATAKTNKDFPLGALTATKTLAAACDLIQVPSPGDAGIDRGNTIDPDHRDGDAVDHTVDGPDGGGEVVACETGRHLCPGDICGDDTSVDTCGTRCDPCPLPPNAAQTTCDGTTCGVVCKSSFHLCAGACVSDTAVETCGASCTTACSVPTGGTATCDGTSCGGQCPANQKLCAGACIGMDQTCLDKCPSGKHDCNGLCVADTSPSSCGTSACTACPTPTNGTATCTAGACGLTCNTGYKKCSDGSCVPTSACCSSSDCPPVTNGIASCGTGHACVTACNNGFHLCGSTCASNLAVATCGTSCTACTVPGAGGSATCENGTCGGSCPTGMRLCLGTCIGPSSPCSDKCPTGTHNCSGQCLADSSVNSCGTTSCTTCPAPANATPTCAGGSCGWTCNASYRTCNNGCIPSGSCCTATDCPGATNGTATCSTGHTCGITCKTGYHLCGNVCSDNTSTASCGGACSACSVPTGGSASCTNGVCGAGCPTGYILCNNACILGSLPCNGSCPVGTHNCSGQCLSNSSPSSCGATSCTPCNAPANATATCSSTGSCGTQCNNGYRLCKGGCIPSGSCCDNTECSGGSCLNGICCPAGQTNCNGTCVNLQSSTTDCGGCGMACTLTCNMGTCEDCDGTPGNWDGCRGTGCYACTDALVGFTKYFQNHPRCMKNDTCAGQFYTCNSKCPPPSAADM